MSEATLSRTTHSAAPADNVGKGIALILLSSALFVTMNTGVKWLSRHLSPMEIGFFRQLFSTIPLSIIVAREGGLAVLRTRRPLGHLFRGTIGNLAMIPYILSLAWLPLADATALTFSSPLFITALSAPLLGEAVGLHRWSAVVVGLIGVIIMTNPSAAMFTHGGGAGAAMGVLAAFSSALMMITVRQLGKTEAPATTVFYFTVIGGVIFGAILPFVWVRPEPLEWLALVGVGILGGLSQFVMTSAYRHAPAALLAPFSYSSIVWGTLFGYLLWDQLPGSRMVIGLAVVIASGLYIMYRETRRHIRRESTMPVAGLD